jgi:hypothetical protein
MVDEVVELFDCGIGLASVPTSEELEGGRLVLQLGPVDLQL